MTKETFHYIVLVFSCIRKSLVKGFPLFRFWGNYWKASYSPLSHQTAFLDGSRAAAEVTQNK
jgi:hypothetical protein